MDAEASRPQLHSAQAPRTSKAQTSQIVRSGLRKNYGSSTTHLGAVTQSLWPRPHARPSTPSPRGSRVLAGLSLLGRDPREDWRADGGCELHVLRGYRGLSSGVDSLGAVSARNTVTSGASPRQPGLLPSRPRAQMVLHLLSSPTIWRGEQRPQVCSCSRGDPDPDSPDQGKGWSAAPLPYCSCSEKSMWVHRIIPPSFPHPPPLPCVGPVRDTRTCTHIHTRHAVS